MLFQPRSTNEDGFSLVELLVAVVILSIVGGVVISAILSGLGSQSRTTERLDALHELEIAVQRASRDLRAASPLVLSTTELASQSAGVRFERAGQDWEVFYEIVDGDEGKELVQFTSVDGSSTEQRLVTRIDNEIEDDDEETVLVPVFRYFDSDGNPIECDNRGSAGATCRAQLSLASSVAIDLVRMVPEGEPVQVSTTVSILSVRYRS